MTFLNLGSIHDSFQKDTPKTFDALRAFLSKIQVLGHLLALSLAPLTQLLAPHCSLCSFVHSLAHSLAPGLMGKGLFFKWTRRFHTVSTHKSRKIRKRQTSLTMNPRSKHQSSHQLMRSHCYARSEDIFPNKKAFLVNTSIIFPWWKIFFERSQQLINQASPIIFLAFQIKWPSIFLFIKYSIDSF